MFSCEGCCCHFLFTQIGAIVIVAVPYFLLLFLLLRWCFFNPDAGSLVFFIFLSFYGGLVGWCYIHFMWVKPSRHLLLGIQQVGISQAFLMKSFTNNRSKSDTLEIIDSVHIFSHPVICPQVPALDVDSLRPLPPTCLPLLLLHDKEAKHPAPRGPLPAPRGPPSLASNWGIGDEFGGPQCIL